MSELSFDARELRLFGEALDSFLPLPRHLWFPTQGYTLPRAALDASLAADLDPLKGRLLTEFRAGCSGEDGTDLDLAKALLAVALAREIHEAISVTAGRGHADAAPAQEPGEDPEDDPPRGGPPRRRSQTASWRAGRLSELVLVAWAYRFASRRCSQAGGSAFGAREGAPAGREVAADRAGVDAALDFFLANREELFASLADALRDFDRVGSPAVFVRAVRQAVRQLLGHAGRSFRAVVDRALREACVELDLAWILTTSGVLDHVLAVPGRRSKVASAGRGRERAPAPPRLRLRWTGIAGAVPFARVPHAPHVVGGTLHVRCHGRGLYLDDTFVPGGAEVRLPRADRVTVTLLPKSWATLHERDRMGVVSLRRHSTRFALVAGAHARESLAPYVLRGSGKGAQGLAVVRELVVDSLHGCVVNGTPLPAGTRRSVDLAAYRGPIEVQGSNLLFGRPAAFRRAMRPVWRGCRLVPTYFVEALGCPRETPPVPFLDLERALPGVQLQEVQMTEGGESEMKSEAIAAVVACAVRVGPIHRVDVLRLLLERRTFRPWALSAAVPYAQPDDALRQDRAWTDPHDHALPQDLARLLDLFRTALGPIPATTRPAELRDRVAGLPLFARVVDYLEVDSHPGFPEVLARKLVEHLLDR